MKHILNEDLAKRQKITQKQRDNLNDIYDEILELMIRADELQKSDECLLDSDIPDYLTELEFNLQENWNFEKNDNFHSYWNKLPGCACPVIDNKESFGIHRITNSSCRWHGLIDYSIPEEKGCTDYDELYESEIDDLCQECWDPDCPGCSN